VLREGIIIALGESEGEEEGNEWRTVFLKCGFESLDGYR
jgi:hypothetical protein